MSETLAPCPFCGAQPVHDYFPVSNYPHEIYCEACIGVVATQQKTFDEAKDKWNQRAESADHAALQQRVKELEAELQQQGWQLAGCEIELEAVRKHLQSHVPVYDDMDRWLYGEANDHE